MTYLSLSAEATKRLRQLDDAWEEATIKKLPFPIAYVLTRVRQESVPWDILLKDALNVLLRYLAILGVSEYLLDGDSPDFDVNDDLKNIGRVMSEVFAELGR